MQNYEIHRVSYLNCILGAYVFENFVFSKQQNFSAYDLYCVVMVN